MKKAKPFMIYVVRSTTRDSYGAMWLLECGHEVYRYGKNKPFRLHCLRCERRAEEKKEQEQS